MRLVKVGPHRAGRPSRIVLVAVAASIGLLGACGGDDAGDAGTGGAEAGGDEEAPSSGEDLFDEKGCAGCHRTDVAPDLEGIYMEEVELEDGSTVVADDEYLERSIRDPGADIVDGATLKMPTVSLSDEEIEQLVAYIRDLES